MGDFNIFEIIRQNIKVEDFKESINKRIAQKLYEEWEKGNWVDSSKLILLWFWIFGETKE